jgi:hypothetical protein
MRAPRLLSFAAALLWVVALLGRAEAQPLTRQLVPVPFNSNTPVSLSVSLDQRSPQIGSTVSICFQSSRAGYATLWNIATNGSVGRVFPNQYAQSATPADPTRGINPASPGPAASVDADRRYCAGTSGDPFRFRVDGPAGTEDLYLLWTARPDLQPPAASYADAQSFVADMQRLAAANPNDWASTKVTYDIVPAAGPAPLPLPPQRVSGQPASPPNNGGRPEVSAPKVWIFAMGANVAGLTKSNLDAALFTRAVKGLFNVEADHIRVVDNGKNADFRDAMEWLRTNAKPNDFVFIYFSGHGGRFRSNTSEDGWDEFLVPYDFEDPHPDPKTLLFSQLIAGLINRLPTKNVVAVIDACHSAGVFRSIEAAVLGARSKFYPLPPELEQQVLEFTEFNAPRTRAMGGAGRISANGLLLAAAHRDANALEGSAGSFFTLALVQEMMSRDGGTLEDAFNRSIATTERMTNNRQEPEAVGDMGVGRRIVFHPNAGRE